MLAAGPLALVQAQDPSAPTAASQSSGTNPEVERLLSMAWKQELAGKLADAETTYKDAVTFAEKIEDAEQKAELPRALRQLGRYYNRRHDWEAARQAGERSLELYKDRFGPADPQVATARSVLGFFAVEADQFAKAEPNLRWVLDSYWRDPKSVEPADAADAAHNLAVALRRQGRSADAVGIQIQSITIRGLQKPRDDGEVARSWRFLAWLYDDQKRSAEAVAAREAAVAAAERLQDPLDDTLPTILIEQANWHRRYGKVDVARAAAEKAAGLRMKARSAIDPATMEARLVLAHILVQQGQRSQSDQEYAAILAAYRSGPNKDRGQWAGTAGCELGRSYRIQKRSIEAVPALLTGVEARELSEPDDIVPLAFCYRVLAYAYDDQNKPRLAEPAFRKSLELYDKAGKGEDADTGHVHYGLGSVLFELGRYREAEEALRRAVALFAKDGDPLTVAVAEARLVTTLRYLRRLDEAEALARKVLAVREAKLKPDDPLVGEALFGLAAALRWQSKNAEAEPLYRRAHAIRAKAYGPDSQHALADRYGLAMAIDGLGRATEAEGLLRQLLADRERALGSIHVDVADTLVSLAWNLRRQGRFAEAVPIAERPLAIYRQALGPEHPTIVSGLLVLAAVRRDRSEYDEAEQLYREALRIRTRVYGATSVNVVDSYGDLMRLSMVRRQFEEAEAWGAMRLTIYESWFGASDPRLLDSLVDFQVLKSFNGDFEAVDALAKRTLDIVERAYGPESLAVGVAAANVAYAYRLRDRIGNVESFYERPLAIYRKLLGPRHPWVAAALTMLADARISLGQSDEALSLLDEAISILVEKYGENSPVLSMFLNNKALLLMQLDKMEEAERLMRRSVGLLRQGAGKPTADLALVLVNLSFVVEATGRQDEAETLRQEAVDIYAKLFGPNRLPPIVPAPLLPPPARDI